MSKGNTTENDVLEHLFKATALSWAANANLYIALHTGDPGSGGLTATASAVGEITATLAGSGAVTGTIASGTIVTRPPVVIPYPPVEYPIPAFISARLTGGGALNARVTATADASATIAGRAELAAGLGATVDISASLAGVGGLDATGTTRGRGFAADNDFWLLAA